MNLNELRDKIHANAIEKGFWDNPLSDSHCLMLVITELSEAVEADRKGNYCYSKMSSTDKYTAFPTEESRFKKEFSAFVKDTVEDEFADVVIRLLDLAGARSIDLSFATMDNITERNKMNFNYHSFTEKIFQLCEIITKPYDSCRTEIVINDAIDFMNCIVQSMDIDLFWHIQQKMKYNELREKMHGKKY